MDRIIATLLVGSTKGETIGERMPTVFSKFFKEVVMCISVWEYKTVFYYSRFLFLLPHECNYFLVEVICMSQLLLLGAELAQLDKVDDSGSGGPQFESRNILPGEKIRLYCWTRHFTKGLSWIMTTF